MTPRIRMVRPDDAPELLAMYAPAVTETAINFEIVPPTLPEYEQRIAGIVERYPWLICEIGDSIAGFAFAGPHRPRPAYQWSVEFGVYVHASFRNRRVGRALYRSLLALVRIQGFHSAYAGITIPNQASVALHESVGFEPVGVYKAAGFKLGKWHDAIWYQRQISDVLPNPPQPPLLPSTLIGTPAWEEALNIGLTELDLDER